MTNLVPSEPEEIEVEHHVGQPAEDRRTFDVQFGRPRRFAQDRRKGVAERRSGTDRRQAERR